MMDPGERWKSRLAKFNNSVCHSMFIEENVKREILLDILQDLFAENLKEDIRMQFILFIEENIDILITDLVSAEQSFGALQNFYHNFLGNHLILLKCQVLATMTTIMMAFNFKKEKSHLYQTLLDVCLDTIFEVNTGHPLIRKTCSQCLLLLEDSDQGTLCEYVTNMLATAKAERSFVSFDHMLLLASIVDGVDKLFKSDVEDKEISHLHPPDLSKCISFLVDQTRNLSPTGLLQVMIKLLPCLESGKVPKSLVNTILSYSFQSWDLLLIYLSVYTQINYPMLLQQQYIEDPCMTLIVKLLLAKSMDQFPALYGSFMQYWIRGSFRNLSPSIQQNASFMTFSYLNPSIYEKISTLPTTLDTIVSVTEHSSIELPSEMQGNLLNIVLKSAQNIRSSKDTSAFFHGLFNLYIHGEQNTKDRVLQHIEDIAVNSLRLVANTIDFCESIELFSNKHCSFDLLKRIMQRLLLFSTRDILQNFRHYLAMTDYVASVKDIWPLAIIQKLTELVQLPVLYSCSWADGSLLLSVCKSMLLANGGSMVIRHGVASILWEISQNFVDSNLNDRALFYYSIVGNLSPKYYDQVLLSSSAQHERTGHDINEVGKVLNTGPPCITNVKNNFLSFKIKAILMFTTSSQWHIEKFSKKSSSSKYTNKIEYNTEQTILETYRASLAVEQYDKSVTKNFRFSFNDIEGDDIPNEIYAVQIKLSTTGPYQEMPGIICPYLFRNPTTVSSNSDGEEFSLEFIPNRPCPAEFTVSASFIDGDSKCWQAVIPSFTLTFPHLMQKLPFVENKPDCFSLFDQLWDDIEKNQKSIDNSESKNALSIKSLGNVPREKILNILGDFLCEDQDGVLKFGIYLPPSNNALLRVVFTDDCTVVKIAVDNFMLLDYIDEFFADMT